MIQAAAYTDARGRYVDAAAVDERDGGFWHGDQPVRREFGKMGKSLRNAVTPGRHVSRATAPTPCGCTRCSPDRSTRAGPWDTKAVVGVFRLLQRIWRNVVDENSGEVTVSRRRPRRRHAAGAAPHHRTPFATGMEKHAVQRVDRPHHRAEQPPDRPLPRRRRAALGGRAAGPAAGAARPAHQRGAVVPAGPRPTRWPTSRSRWPTRRCWPTRRSRSRCASTARCARGSTCPADADAEAVEAAARADERVAALLEGADVRRVIAVPGRLINFVVG